jgi:hypothetical protein
MNAEKSAAVRADGVVVSCMEAAIFDSFPTSISVLLEIADAVGIG